MSEPARKAIDVLCIGHATYDISMFLDSFPPENTKLETTNWSEAGGGPAANAAWLLASWGVKCGFAGLVGDDFHGTKIVEDFEKAGADISLLERQKDYATPLSVILVNRQNASRTVINRKISGACLEIDDAKLQRF